MVNVLDMFKIACREQGYAGKLILLSADTSLPYYRPQLSKRMDATAAEIALQDEDWFNQAGIEVQLNTRDGNLYSYCQDLCQQTSWLLIGCTRVNNQSDVWSSG